MKRLSLVPALFIIFSVSVYGQSHAADSLKKAYAICKSDTDKVNTLLRLGAAYENTNPDTSLTLSMQALHLARKISWDRGIVNSLYDLGIFSDTKGDAILGSKYEDTALALCQSINYTGKLSSIYNAIGNLVSEVSQYSKGLDYYFKALAIDSISNKKAVPDVMNNIGLNYEEQGNYSKAEEYYFKALNLYSPVNNQDGIATTETNLGNIYNLQGNYQKALKSHFKALKIDSIGGKENNVALDYSNIGNTYTSLGMYSYGLDYAFKAIRITLKLNISGNIPNCYANIGNVFIENYERDSLHNGFHYTLNGKPYFVPYKNLLDSAYVYEEKSLKVSKETGNKVSIIYADRGLGDIYDYRMDYTHAIECFQQAYDIADTLGTLKEKMENAQLLANTFIKVGKFELSAKYFQITNTLKDSLFSQDKEKEIGKLETQYEYDKKILEQHTEEEKEKAVEAEKEKRQQFAIVSISAGLIVVLALLLVIFRRFRITNEQKKVIEEQKQEVDTAYSKLNATHALLQEKDKDITDSIAYARKIQTAILPSEEYLKKSLGDYFVLYKPRDVVSGDFYWCHEEGNKVAFAVVDCTGHGVPGAFMSMIGNSILNQVVIENNIYDSAEALNQVRANLLKQLQQKGQEAVSRDGMDMAVCIWDKSKNTIQYSGANSSLYLVRKGIANGIENNPKFRLQGTDMLEILPDKQPIGYQEGRMESSFTSQTIQLKKGDCIYLSSDGYHDQFGGERNKKFTSKEFRELLIKVSGNPLAEQKNILSATIEKWKADYAQTDDICVIGVKI